MTSESVARDEAARAAVRSSPGRIWYSWQGPGVQDACRLTPASLDASRPYDVAVIGAGVIGCALAYVLSQCRLRIVVVDKAYDVGEGTSKANSAIIHTGFDASPGSLESTLVTSASRQWPGLAERLKIPFASVGAVMLALNEEQLRQLPKLKEKAHANGVDDVALLSAEEVRRVEPHVSSDVLGGLHIPREGIADPFTTSIAFAEVALANGVDFLLGANVSRVESPGELVKTLIADEGVRIASRYIVNASGFGARALVDSYQGEPMDLNPRRGQFIVYDRSASQLASRILLPIPTEKTKGMLVAPTIFGNLLAGPTAEDLAPDQVGATNTTFEGLLAVRERAVAMCPELENQPVIAAYAGLRCNCAQGSYWMRFNDGHPGIVTLAGIRSTGFTSSISTAQYVAKRLAADCGLSLEPNSAAADCRPENRWPGWFRRPFEDPRRVQANSEYGRIVCFCENISAGEINDAMNLVAGQATLDGLKRRTRVLTGRCQGFNCCVPVAEMISRRFAVPLSHVTKRGPGTEFIVPQPSVVIPRRTPSPAQDDKLESSYRVVVVGGGPAGIGVSVGLAKRGVRDVLLVDRDSALGGVPARYRKKSKGVPTFLSRAHGRIVYGEELVAWMTRQLSNTSTQVARECHVTCANRENRTVTLVSPHGKSTIAAGAIVFACGARERTIAERGWITGHRPARVFFTMQLLQLLEGCGVTPIERPLILGSDLVAFSAAAKLQASGARQVFMSDHRRSPAARALARWYFRRWTRPAWQPAPEGVVIEPQFPSMQRLDHVDRKWDGVVTCGDLLPNSELAAAAGLEVRQPDRIPILRSRHGFARPGWFVVGAEKCGFLGAEACYRDGLRAAAEIARHLPLPAPLGDGGPGN